MIDPNELLESDDQPMASKLTVWSDAQWNEAQIGLPDGQVSLPGYVANPYEIDKSFLSTRSLVGNKKKAALVLSGYAKALAEICRTADGLAGMWEIEDAGFDKLLKTAELKLKKLQRMAHTG
jgi:hypothetical protein